MRRLGLAGIEVPEPDRDGVRGRREVGEVDRPHRPHRRLQAFVQMAIPEPDAKAISRLEFSLSAVLPIELYEADVPNPEEGSEAGQGAFHVVLADFGS